MTSKPQSQEPLQAARGMHDVLPQRAEDHAKLETLARKLFEDTGFREIRTPILESVSLFERAIGEATDIVEKEMFTLKDRGDRLLALRPEGTAGVVRAFIDNHLANDFPGAKFFYIGHMFRAERPQKGRYREFVQIGAEWFGKPRPEVDAMTIYIAYALIRGAGIKQCHIFINSIGCAECRPGYLGRLLQFLNGKMKELCQNCRIRIKKNPLRVLDCKEDANKFLDAPKTIDFLCKGCRDHHDRMRTVLGWLEVPVTDQTQLVRGLDYYTRTVFEIYATGKTGSQDALAAGGRYDNLVERLGGQPTPAVGFALGVERVLNEIEAQGPAPAPERRGVFMVPLGETAFESSHKLLHQLQEASVPSETGWPDQSIKSQMRLADRLEMEFCVIIGENEIKDNFVMLKNLNKQTQEKVPMGEIVKKLQDYYTGKK